MGYCMLKNKGPQIAALCFLQHISNLLRASFAP